MNIRNQRLIEKYIQKKTTFLNEEWYEKDVWTRQFLVAINESWWEGGYDAYSLPSEKVRFYTLVQQALDIILDYAHNANEKICCIGPFHNFENYEHWSNKNEYDSFNSIKEYICNSEYVLIDIESHKELLGLIIENGFRYLTRISIYLPKTDVIIEAENHTQLFIYANDLIYLKKLFEQVVCSYNGWKIKINSITRCNTCYGSMCSTEE